jgi:hypothetical protein
MASIWVHAYGVQEIGGLQGFVETSDAIAEKLIKAGKAQDPQVGALSLIEIECAPPEKPTVQTKTVVAEPSVAVEAAMMATKKA